MKSDTSEKGLESLIVAAMTGRSSDAKDNIGDPGLPVYLGSVWIAGDANDYDREYAVDLFQLRLFLEATQKTLVEAFDLGNASPARRQFLARLQGEVAKRGVIDVLRHGVKHGAHHVDFFYGTPSPGNAKAAELFAQNRFTVTRQLRYSRDETQRALDIGIFINGLPVATFELKNSLTKLFTFLL